MDCNKADGFLMKYMDGELNEQEAVKLNAHLSGCEKCSEDFALYDRIMLEFSGIELINAPDGLESAVMAKIGELTDIAYRSDNRLDSIIWGVWGTFSVLMGGGFLLAMNREAVLAYLEATPELNAYMGILYSASGYVSQTIADITAAAGAFSSTAMEYLTSFRYVLLSVFVVLAVIQYTIYKRDKVGV